MTLEQVGLQLGIAGLLAVIGYRIALVLIRTLRESDKERTSVLKEQLASIVSSVNAHSVADLQSHAMQTEQIARFDAKLDAVLEQHQRERTPVQGVPIVRSVPVGEFDDGEETPPLSRIAAERQQTRVVRGTYRQTRIKTNGEDK